jgi:sortase A
MSGARRRTGAASVVSVLGEIVLTIAVIGGLYIVWSVWINDAVSDVAQSRTAHAFSNEWGSGSAAEPGSPVESEPEPAAGSVFANLIVPRFGADYIRPIAEGTGHDVLNDTAKGVGHYPSTELPGEGGNFAIASHRSAYGGALHRIDELRLGDDAYVETAAGWYRYVYRNTEYVQPTATTVLASVPRTSEKPGDAAFLTLTTCNPLYSTAERIVAYAVFDSFRPRSDGPPAEIADLYADEVG